jgi:hypothetical protein
VVPLPLHGTPLLGLFACLNFGPCPLFLFLSFSWVLSFYEVTHGLNNFFIKKILKKKYYYFPIRVVCLNQYSGTLLPMR